MNKKSHHPKDRGERRRIAAKKKIHSNASPVFKLLNEREALLRHQGAEEKEELDAAAKERDRELHP